MRRYFELQVYVYVKLAKSHLNQIVYKGVHIYYLLKKNDKKHKKTNQSFYLLQKKKKKERKKKDVH